METDEITKIFENTSFLTRCECNVLAFLLCNDDYVTSHDIERATSLRQPEVSVVLSKFNKYGWLEEKKSEKQGKGRPAKLIKLSNMDEIFKSLLDDMDEKMNEYRQKRDELLKLYSFLNK